MAAHPGLAPRHRAEVRYRESTLRNNDRATRLPPRMGVGPALPCSRQPVGRLAVGRRQPPQAVVARLFCRSAALACRAQSNVLVVRTCVAHPIDPFSWLQGAHRLPAIPRLRATTHRKATTMRPTPVPYPRSSTRAATPGRPAATNTGYRRCSDGESLRNFFWNVLLFAICLHPRIQMSSNRTEVFRLAIRFAVSEQVLTLRLFRLGYIQPD